MNRKHVWIPTVLLVCVWLGACNRSDEQASSRSASGTRTGATYFGNFGLIVGEGVDSYASGDAAFGTCADDSEFFADCEAPLAEPALAEPASQTEPEAIPPDTICTATRDRIGLSAITDATASERATAPITVRQEHVGEVLTSRKRCGKTNSSMAIATNGDPGDATICSCRMKLCGCG